MTTNLPDVNIDVEDTNVAGVSAPVLSVVSAETVFAKLVDNIDMLEDADNFLLTLEQTHLELVANSEPHDPILEGYKIISRQAKEAAAAVEILKRLLQEKLHKMFKKGYNVEDDVIDLSE